MPVPAREARWSALAEVVISLRAGWLDEWDIAAIGSKVLTRSSFTAAHSFSLNFFVSSFCGSGSTCGFGAGVVVLSAMRMT